MMNFEAISHRCAFSDCYAINKDEIRINLKTGKDIKKVILVYEDPFMNGMSNKRPFVGKEMEMKIRFECKHHFIWSCIASPEYKRMQYYFVIFDEWEKVCLLEDDFYSDEDRLREGKYTQYFIMPWMNISDIAAEPSWVKDTIWYQMMPDRFCRKSNGDLPEKFKQWADEEEMTYEDFYGGNLQGIISKLDYIKSLGVSGIYLTPIFRSKSNHKYNVIDYEQIDPDFGTEEDFIELVDTAHKKGIKIMIDAVFNHCGAEFSKWQDVIRNKEESSYYKWFFINKFPIDTGDYKTKDGRYYSFAFEAGMPKLNTNEKEVVDYFIGICKHWVKDYKIDGIRFDVGNEISHSFVKKLRTELKELNPNLYLLGEIWHDSIQWLQGDEYDSVMNYPFMEIVHDFWSDEEKDAKELMYALNRIFALYTQQTEEVLFNFLDTHDTKRAVSRCGSIDIMLQQFAFLCTLQGSICLYYGTELGMEGNRTPYTRKCMPWNEIEHGKYATISNQICELLRIRNNYSSCKIADVEWKFHKEFPRLIHYKKHSLTNEESGIEVYMNAGNEVVPIKAAGNILFQNKYRQHDLESGGVLIIEN